MLLGTFIVVGAAVAAVGLLVPTSYTASVRIVFSPDLPADAPMETRRDAELYLADRMPTYAQVVTTNAVLQPVIDVLGLGVTVPELVNQVEVTIPSDTLVINVAASAPTAAEAASIANRVANQMPWAVADLEGSPTVDASPIQVSVLQPADIPQYRASPNLRLNLVVAAGLALIAGVFAAVIVDNFDTRVRRRRDITALGVPFLGGIPTVRDAKTRDLLQFAELAPEIRSTLHRVAIDVLYAVDETPTFLLFTSPRAGAGKTMAAANVAGALATAGNRVIFIDADIRGGRLAAQVGITQTPGITDLFSGRVQLDPSFFQRQWAGFTVVPCGGSALDVGEMLAGEKFGVFMRDLVGHFDVVIVDAPPISDLSEASRFTQNISNVVVVCESGTTRRAELVRVTGSLRHAGAKVVGVVLSRVRRDEEAAPPDESRDDVRRSDQ
ncbi:polysaccharide biosynthesis tyrosine autokinase [Mycolicibacterium poriferae]|uniref:Capsular exopolysaccharide biosynthesis protein n=1 Tax=Mycolicibacterium poriferae TaxID=39694 RepID=A0A6N4VB88_9MYCO|nr:capsular exopolysaccharide biosynthesis protein [Mycolicibacterium poriferae]